MVTVYHRFPEDASWDTLWRMASYAENRKARHEFHILETFEAGLALTGSETKAIREGGAKLTGGYLHLIRGELWLESVHISPYSKQSKTVESNPLRARRVLMHKKELANLEGKTEQKGLTLVPLSLYPSARRIKLSFGLCRGKKAHDKRDAIKERDLTRQFSRFHDDEL